MNITLKVNRLVTDVATLEGIEINLGNVQVTDLLDFLSSYSQGDDFDFTSEDCCMTGMEDFLKSDESEEKPSEEEMFVFSMLDKLSKVLATEGQVPHPASKEEKEAANKINLMDILAQAQKLI